MVILFPCLPRPMHSLGGHSMSRALDILHAASERLGQLRTRDHRRAFARRL